jgi:hypothetical protein
LDLLVVMAVGSVTSPMSGPSPPACQVGDSWLAGLWLYSTTAPARASTTPEPAAMSSK